MRGSGRPQQPDIEDEVGLIELVDRLHALDDRLGLSSEQARERAEARTALLAALPPEARDRFVRRRFLVSLGVALPLGAGVLVLGLEAGEPAGTLGLVGIVPLGLWIGQAAGRRLEDRALREHGLLDQGGSTDIDR